MMGVHYLAAERQSQPGSTAFPLPAAFSLHKSIKNCFQLLGSYSDTAVANGDPDEAPPLRELLGRVTRGGNPLPDGGKIFQ